MAGAVGDTHGITAHQIWAVTLADGAVKSGYPIDVSTTLGFDPKAHNQRGALSLVGGILYVPYGGHSGDCAGFQGRIVTVNTAASPPRRRRLGRRRQRRGDLGLRGNGLRGRRRVRGDR